MVSDKTRREAFITQNLGLVHACAGRFRGRGIEYDDLYGAGCMGLVKACDNFDPERGVCFSTYAVPVILGEIKKLFREGGTVKVSDKTRREAFITQNLGLVHACAGRFRGRGIEYDDLYGAGCMGLVKACDNFDPERGVCFSTYAVPVILGEIKKLFREGGTVKVSRSLKELGMRVQAAREHTMKLCGTEPTLSQLAEQLGESVENVAMAIQAAQPAMSLTPEGREDAEHQLDIPVESPEEALADRISLEEVLRALPEQDRQLIQLRFYGNRTQSETAKVLHTTQVQISRRERKILVLLRRRLLEE